MDILVFTDNANTAKTIREGNRGNREHFFNIFPVSQFNRELKNTAGPALFYLDAAGFRENMKKQLNLVSKSEYIFFGIIDVRGSSQDIAELIFSGMVDYIKGPANIKTLNEKRIRKVLAYLEEYRLDFLDYSEEEEEASICKQKIISTDSWEDIQPDQEYTFMLMYIGLDDREDMEINYNKANLENAVATFQKYVDRHIRNFKGRPWIWSGFEGVYLFPFNGRECPPVLCGLQMYLYKFIYDVEESPFPNFISFKTCLHLGNLVYTEKNKGNLVSDSINTLFHLGRRFATRGNLYITGDVYNFMRDPLRNFFNHKGQFENKKIYKMKMPHPEINHQ